MSLELKIEANTLALSALATAMQSFVTAIGQLGAPTGDAPEGTKRTRRTKEQIAADAAAEAAKTAGDAATEGSKTEFADGINHSHDVVTGDPEGTIYWLIAKHSTVYAQKPGETGPNIEGAVRVGAIEFIQKKEEFAKKSLTAQGAAQTGSTATQGDSSPKPDASPASGVSFQQLTAKLMELNSSKEPGHGREALKAFLVKHLGEGKTVPALEALKKNAELLAEVEAILKPAGAADDNLFG